jgi:Zn finger protein HypA/HybF involved in hydrogenase expression
MTTIEQKVEAIVQGTIAVNKKSLQYIYNENCRQRIQCEDCTGSVPKDTFEKCPECVKEYQSMRGFYLDRISQIENKSGEYYEQQVKLITKMIGG